MLACPFPLRPARTFEQSAEHKRRNLGRAARWLFILTVLTAATRGAAPARADDAAPSAPQLGDARLSIQLDPKSGALVEIRCAGVVVTRAAADAASFELRQEGTWIGGGKALSRLLRFQAIDAHRAVATTAVGDWEIDCHYTIDARWPSLARWLKITWKGHEPTKLKGLRMALPALRAGARSSYFFPGVYPPKSYAAADYQAGAEHSSHQNLSPLVVQLSRAGSMLAVTDELLAMADRSSVTVREEADGLRITQGFNIQARMKPGDSQEVGTAYLGFVAGDGRQALRRLPDWLRRHGLVPPPDRPAWMADAVLYAFHPGGTTGSHWRDLGGFKAALPLLDRAARLGATALWILPIEDASPYQPRDYYKFQDGLGTAEEYRALVAHAHQLGLHVLQDCVPHGGRNDSPRARQHPEWLVQNEDGSTLDYWCDDFNWPSWQQYMAAVAAHYVHDFDVDGYRVDAVGGSKIPNWNPRIPYARASQSQSQGGLNMLRSLRGVVKELKPADGGLLAEVQGGLYGAVSDAVYDFTGCYQVFQDLRRLPPAEFVARLRTWLDQQQAADPPGLLRLRHIESHDSLRSALCYGIAPQRALMALTAWIQGIPLVYQEVEEGHAAAFRRIFAIRKALPELRRGAADYLAVDAPPEMFACLRATDDDASLVLVNFAPRPVDALVQVRASDLPPILDQRIAARDMWRGRDVPAQRRQGVWTLPVSLPAYGFTVLALRSGRPVDVPQDPDWPAGSDLPPIAAESGPAAQEPPPPAPAATLSLSGEHWRAVIERRSGLLERFDVDGQTVLGPADLHLPAALRGPAVVDATLRREETASIFTRRVGPAQLELRYQPQDCCLQLKSRWTGSRPESAALLLPVVGAQRWFVGTAEGLLGDDFHVRHALIEPLPSNIYWRPQGTSLIWDSALQPLPPRSRDPLIGAVAGGKLLSLGFDEAPARVAWLERQAERPDSRACLTARMAWHDPQAVGGPAEDGFTLYIGSRALASPTFDPAQALRPVAGGWEFANTHYRLRLSRSGTIVGLWTADRPERPIIDNADLYTDHGFATPKDPKEGERYGQAIDVEAGSRIWEAEGATHIRFEGQLRGFQRFALLRPPVEYFAEYVLSPAAGFRATCGIRPHEGPRGKSAFLGLMLPVPDVAGFSFRHEGRVLHEETLGGQPPITPLSPGGRGAGGEGTKHEIILSGAKGRSWQTGLQSPPIVPDAVELRGPAETLLRLTELQCGGAAALQNIFVDGRNFFLTWFDGPPAAAFPPGWRWFSAVWTAGQNQPAALGQPAAPPALAEAHGLLRDAGFEDALAHELVSLRSGAAVGPPAASDEAWIAPAGGRLVRQPVHEGLAAAEVGNTTGDYALWRQTLHTAHFPAGSRWRLSAWVKGRQITPGDASWKTCTLRFAVVTDRTTYVAASAASGTFDWRQLSVELTIPAGLRALRVEAGLNGAKGTMWIDDVRLEKE